MYQLRTFWEVSRAGSITKAGRRLGYSQSTVTSHVRALEAQAGVPLFQRLPHGVRLTEAGETFRNYASRMLSVVDELSAALAAGGEISGRVSIGAAAFLMDQEATKLIWECRYRYPRVEVSPVGMDAARIVDEVAAGRLDMGLLLAMPDHEWEGRPGIALQDLHPIDLVCVASSALRGPGRHLSKTLRGARILQVDTTCASQDLLLSSLERGYGVRPEVMQAGSVGGALELMRTGSFVGLLPAQAVEREIANGEVFVLDEVPRLRSTVRMIWVEQPWLPPALTAMLDLARRTGQAAGAGGPGAGSPGVPPVPPVPPASAGQAEPGEALSRAS